MNNFKKFSHVQLEGEAHYGVSNEQALFMFAPDNPVPGNVTAYSKYGWARLMADGTFDFVDKPRKRAQTVLIRKLAHGRVSKMKDGAVRLTLTIGIEENINIADAFSSEVYEACGALRNFQLKR